jgi:hypothetical protein
MNILFAYVFSAQHNVLETEAIRDLGECIRNDPVSDAWFSSPGHLFLI